MKKIKFIIPVFLFFYSVSFAQNITPIWNSVYQGTGDNSDRFNKIIPDGQGNFIGVGYTFKPDNYRDFLTVKFDERGDTIWWRTKNGNASENDEAISVCVDASGNVIVAGYSVDGESQDDILIIKYDAAGNKLWDADWNSPSSMDDQPIDLKCDNFDNIYVAGNAEPDTFQGSNDFITLKYSPNGALLWEKQYSRTGAPNRKDEVGGITLANNNVYITGRSESMIDDDIVTICYNGTSGNQEWIQIYNAGNGNDRGKAIASDPSGNIIITGRSDNGNNDDVRTIKYSGIGLLQWSKVYNAPANNDDEGLYIISDNNENVYITGESKNNNGTFKDFVTLKYNSAGTIQWSNVLGGNAQQDDIPSSIAVDASGNLYVTGKCDQDITTSTNNDFLTVKYNASGSIQWRKEHSGSQSQGSDIPSSLCIDVNGNIYVAGGSENAGTSKDASVVKYDPSGNEVWVKNFNGEGDFSETAKSIIVDNSNNSFIGGYSFRLEHERDATIVKVDPSGNVVCSFVFNGTNSADDEINTMCSDQNGNVYAGGYTKGLDTKSDFLIVKLNTTNCDTVWTRTYNFINQSDKIESIACDVAGNIYVTGKSDSDPQDSLENSDIVTLKYDGNGNLVWTQRYNGSGNLRDEPSKLLIDNAGNIIVCGLAENIHDDDFIVLKYDASTGNPIWSSPAIYTGPFSNDDRALDMCVDASDNIFVSGYSQTGSNPAPEDAVVIKVEPSGNISEVHYYDGAGGTGNDHAVKISTDANGNVYVLYETDADADPLIINTDFLLEKLDNNLIPLWSNPPQYNSPVNKNDNPASLLINGNNIYVIAATESDTLNNTTNKNWITLIYDDQGNQIQSVMYDGVASLDDSPNAFAIKNNSIWVCGYTESQGINRKDMSIVLYDFSVGINEMQSNTQYQVFPNPLTTSSTIKLENTNKGQKKLEIFNSLGSKVSEQVTNEESFLITRGNLNAGLYNFRVTDNSNYNISGKIIIE